MDYILMITLGTYYFICSNLYLGSSQGTAVSFFAHLLELEWESVKGIMLILSFQIFPLRDHQELNQEVLFDFYHRDHEALCYL